MIRLLAPLLLAVIASWLVCQASRLRGLEAPGLGPVPFDSAPPTPLRRISSQALLAAVLYLTVFQSLSTLGQELELDPQGLSSLALFSTHAILAVFLAMWFWLARSPLLGSSLKTRVLEGVSRLGLRTPGIGRELALGVGAGVLIWVAVLVALLVFRLLLSLIGADDLVPEEPPQLVLWIAALPVPIRAAISLSAGLFEEAFFRGFLQPRVGVLLSTAMFSLAHVAYGEPSMLVGVTLLSLAFSALALWRRNIWAAVTAHATFDAVQLLILIPALPVESP